MRSVPSCKSAEELNHSDYSRVLIAKDTVFQVCNSERHSCLSQGHTKLMAIKAPILQGWARSSVKAIRCSEASKKATFWEGGGGGLT